MNAHRRHLQSPVYAATSRNVLPGLECVGPLKVIMNARRRSIERGLCASSHDD
jgi:hypothetical protein